MLDACTSGVGAFRSPPTWFFAWAKFSPIVETVVPSAGSIGFPTVNVQHGAIARYPPQ